MKNIEQKIEEAVRITRSLAEDLGRTPLKLEIMAYVSRHLMEKYIGGYDELLSLAGLERGHHGDVRKVLKSSNKMFIQPVPEEVINHPVLSTNIDTNILIAGDTHFPWVHEPTMKLFHEFNGDVKPEYVVQIGDLFDLYAHSRFPKSQNIYTPKDEEARGRAGAELFWETVRRNNPNSKRKQLKGNHDVRPVKRAQEHYPEMEHFVEKYMSELMSFEGVETIEDHREIIKIEGISFHHGYLGQLGAHRDAVLENIVVGHTHLGGVSYRGMRDRTLWELNVGLMGDPSSKVMSYTSTKENKWTLGFGYIDKFGPRFIAT